MKIVVLGGGPTGLAAAEILSRTHEVTVLEREKMLGGLAGSFEHDGSRIPMFYHQVLRPDNVTTEYFERFGSPINRKKIRMAIAVDSKIYDFTSPIGWMTFDYLSPVGRISFAAFAAYASFLCDPQKIPADESVEDWLKRHTSAEVKNKIFAPLYAENKFGIPLSMISARQLAVRLRAREAMGDFGYPELGFDFLFDRLAQEIRANGGKIELNTVINAIDVRKKEIHVQGRMISYDALLCTLPPRTLVHLATNLPMEYARALSKIEYCPAVCVTFGTDDFISPYYWTNFFGERAHTLFQHSILHDHYATKVNWILRYGGSGADIGLPDQTILDAYLGVVRKYHPKANVRWAKVFRAPNAEPIYHKDYATMMPTGQSPVEGLYLAGIALTYPEIRSTNTAIIAGRKAAQIMEEGFG